MSFSTLTNRVVNVGDGVATVFAYAFPIISSSDLLVTKRLLATGVETLLALTTDYTVSGAGNANGGNVTLLVALPATYRLVIRRVRPLTQTADIRNQGQFFPETHENAFDHFVMLAQQLRSDMDKCARLVETLDSSDFNPKLPSNITGLANSILGVNGTGNGWAFLESNEIANLGSQTNHSVTDGQAAADLTNESFDGITYSSVAFQYEILRGTTVLSTGDFSMHYRNGTWYFVNGQERHEEAAPDSGVTFSVSQATTVGQLRAALDAGAGNGTIKIKKHKFTV